MIGIFDSGIGGLNVARAVSEMLPEISIGYLGDTAGAPYHTKKAEAVIAYALEHVGFLISQGARLIVIACASTAGLAGQALRDAYSVPIIDIATPTARAAAAATVNGRIGIIGSRASISQIAWCQTITDLQPQCTVHLQSCPLLAGLIEEGWANRQETKMILRRYLHPLKSRQIDTLVLASPHYALLDHLIQPRIGKRVRLIDSAQATARHLHDLISHNTGWMQARDNAGPDQFWFTSLAEPLPTFATTIFQRSNDLKLL